VVDQPFLRHLRERTERLGERARLRGVEPADAEVDDVQLVEAEVLEVLVNRSAKLVGRARRGPPTLGVAAGANLRHDPQILGVGVERLPDDLVGDVRAVVVARVDVVDSQRDGLAQDSDCLIAVGGRAKDVGSGQLHRAVADPCERQVLREGERASGQFSVRHPGPSVAGSPKQGL
jgi:hypothetical protein